MRAPLRVKSKMEPLKASTNGPQNKEGWPKPQRDQGKGHCVFASWARHQSGLDKDPLPRHHNNGFAGRVEKYPLARRQ
jgi:hypothetical protein